MTEKVLVYSHLHDKIRDAVDKGTSFTVMGEIIMFTSAIRGLKARGFNVKIVSSVEEFIKEDRGAVYYILDYLTIEALSRYVLLPGKIHRIRLFCYWGRTQNEIPWRGLSVTQVCTPFPYFHKPNNFLGFVMPDLSAAGAGATGQLDSSVRGYLWGKEEKYIKRDLVNHLGNNGVKFYSTCVNGLNTCPAVTNLGLQPRERYLDIIRHVEFVLGFGDPIAGPTIIETLSLGKILLAPRKQVPEFLHWHPNIVLTDDMSHADILNVIQDIERGHKYRSAEGVVEFTPDSYMQRLTTIFPDIDKRKVCVLRSAMKDNNIFHFLVFEIKAIWDFISKNDRIDYAVMLQDYDPDSAAHRWRRAVIEGLGVSVFGSSDAIPLSLIDRTIMDIPVAIGKGGAMIESFKYIDYKVDAGFEKARDRIRSHYGIDCNTPAPNGLLLIQRRGTRQLYTGDGRRLEDVLGPACAERGIPFTCSYFEDMTFRGQLAAVAGARWIVAAHGAAETNIIFASRGCHLIEVNMRPHWYCDPVCNDHYSGKLRMDMACKGGLKTWPTYHKADYHNLAKFCGVGYSEIEPLRYEGRFTDRNPISKERIVVDCDAILKHV